MAHTDLSQDLDRGQPLPEKVVLNVGCGARPISRLREHFPPPQWRELRLDADPGVQPDIVAVLPDLGMLASASVDAIWCSHMLEHLDRHEVTAALQAFARVLRPGGVMMIAVPDLQAVAAYLAEDRAAEVVYVSAMGPVSALDMVYGFGAALASGHTYMAHRSGFTQSTLRQALAMAGFSAADVYRLPHFELFAIAHPTGAVSSEF